MSLAEGQALIDAKRADDQRRSDADAEADPKAAASRAEFHRQLDDPDSPVRRAADKRLKDMSEVWELIAVRVPSSLRTALEAAARQGQRTLSAEMRLRLGNGGNEVLRIVLAAIRARVPHEQIEQLVKHWEGPSDG